MLAIRFSTGRVYARSAFKEPPEKSTDISRTLGALSVPFIYGRYELAGKSSKLFEQK